jgi:superfamily II DNA or RNA helicase
MSLCLPLSSLQEKDLDTMEKKLVIELQPKQRSKKATPFWKPPDTVTLVHREGDHVTVPFHWGVSYFGKPHRKPREECGALHSRFKGSLRTEQKEIFNESVALLNKTGSCLMAIYPGGGKTITSLSIASAIGFRTMIFVNKLVLIDQWMETIRQWFGETVSVQIIKGKSKALQRGCDFYLVNAVNITKHDFQEYQELGIGLLIVDECHLMVTRVLSQALSYLCPRYLMGLSATPFRIDGFDVLLELYFGLHKVSRKLFRPHTVYFLDSHIHIEHDKDMRGDIIWNSVIDKQMSHPERNARIADLCLRFKNRNILILSKRLQQIQTIANLLRDRGETSVTMMKENETTFDRGARILIATFQKVGTGFSHDKLDMLLLASDIEEYFLQYLGRVFRRPDVEPIIVDIVDRHPILKKHFQSRKKIYEMSGGRIENFL